MGKKSKNQKVAEAHEQDTRRSSSAAGENKFQIATEAEKLLIEGNSLLNTNPTKSMRLFQKARALGLKLDRPRDAMVIERMAVGYLSMAHFKLKEFKMCIALAEQAIALCEKAGDQKLATQNRTNRDVACVGISNDMINASQVLLKAQHPSVAEGRVAYEEARQMLNEMWEKWGDRITDRVMRGKVERTYHLNVGNALCKLGSFKPALECYKTCLAIASEFGDVGDEKAARDNLARAEYEVRQEQAREVVAAGLLATEVVAARENRPATDAGEQAALLDLPNLLNVMRATALHVHRTGGTKEDFMRVLDEGQRLAAGSTLQEGTARALAAEREVGALAAALVPHDSEAEETPADGGAAEAGMSGVEKSAAGEELLLPCGPADRRVDQLATRVDQLTDEEKHKLLAAFKEGLGLE